MPKSVEIDDFAIKLGLLVRRLNWSSAKLAQQVGTDKSVAGRWLKGRSRPTAHSLTQLTIAVAEHVPGLTGTDWELGLDQFALRIGIEPTAIPRAFNRDARLTITGLKHPPSPIWGEPYVGLWAGFYQSANNRGFIRIFVNRFFIDDLGLRLEMTDGWHLGEGPAFASGSHVQCLVDCGPLHDRLIYSIMHGVSARRAFVIDGLMTAIASDTGGTLASSPFVQFRIDDCAGDATIGVEQLKDAVHSVNERAAAEFRRTGDALAAMRELAPTEILETVCPLVGRKRADGEIDYTLCIPAARSLAASLFEVEKAPPSSPLHTVPANLRRVLGLERVTPQRVVGTAGQ